MDPSLNRVERPVDADPKTFKVDDIDVWASDKTSAFYKGRSIGPTDQTSFAAINSIIAKDRQTVWYRGNPIENADARSFTLLEEGYAIDSGYAHYEAASFILCAPDSFEVISGGFHAFAADEQCVYSRSFRIPLKHRESFSLMSAGYSKDRFQVYWRDDIVAGADVETFSVPKGMSYGRDRNGCWLGIHPKECSN